MSLRFLQRLRTCLPSYSKGPVIPPVLQHRRSGRRFPERQVLVAPVAASHRRGASGGDRHEHGASIQQVHSSLYRGRDPLGRAAGGEGSLAPLADLATAFVVREGRTDPIYVDMRGLVTSSASPSDLPLQANDRIVIPPFSSFVSVHGAVFAPGSFPYRAGLPVWYYVSLAGGIDPEKNGNGQVVVTDPQGKSRKASEPPRAGDFIFVSNNKFFYNLNRYAPTVTLIATLVATTITVLQFHPAIAEAFHAAVILTGTAPPPRRKDSSGVRQRRAEGIRRDGRESRNVVRLVVHEGPHFRHFISWIRNGDRREHATDEVGNRRLLRDITHVRPGGYRGDAVSQLLVHDVRIEKLGNHVGEHGP